MFGCVFWALAFPANKKNRKTPTLGLERIDEDGGFCFVFVLFGFGFVVDEQCSPQGSEKRNPDGVPFWINVCVYK